jgi:hypothetical protein
MTRLAWTAWGLHVVMSGAVLLLAAGTPRTSSRMATDSDTLNAAHLVADGDRQRHAQRDRRHVVHLVEHDRRDRRVAPSPHSVGWLLLVVALAAGSEDVAGAYAIWAHQAGAASGGPAHVAVVADAFWIPSVVCSATLVPPLFPDGRLPSRRWRPVAWAAVLPRSCPSR